MMNQNEPITIVVACDNHFAILIVALLKSIDVNHKTNEHINFHIIEDNIASDFKNQLEKVVSPERITIKWFKSREIVPHDIFSPVDSSSFPISIFFRLFAPYIIDKNAEKLIYLDVDTIVQDDISNLWNIPLDNYIIGAVQDYSKTVDCKWAGIPNYEELGLAPDTKYFNSGVLLINPKKWREHNITNEVIEILTKYRKYVKMADQYGLNVIFANEWLELDPKWNWFALYEHEKPSIIHFVEIKPIFANYKFSQTFKAEFYRYLSMTAWKKVKPISGNWRLLRKIQNKLKKIFLKFS